MPSFLARRIGETVVEMEVRSRERMNRLSAIRPTSATPEDARSRPFQSREQPEILDLSTGHLDADRHLWARPGPVILPNARMPLDSSTSRTWHAG